MVAVAVLWTSKCVYYCFYKKTVFVRTKAHPKFAPQNGLSSLANN